MFELQEEYEEEINLRELQMKKKQELIDGGSSSSNTIVEESAELQLTNQISEFGEQYSIEKGNMIQLTARMAREKEELRIENEEKINALKKENDSLRKKVQVFENGLVDRNEMHLNGQRAFVKITAIELWRDIIMYL